jgi:lipopolysaccharide assembly outer membrane protein LptD (OstA)
VFGVSRGKIIFAIVVLLIVLVGLAMRRDLMTNVDEWRKKLPPIMVEHLDFARVINGREWHVIAANAESEGDTIRASSIDVSVSDMRAEKSADVSAARGAFDMENDKMRLYEIAGIVHLSDGSMDIAAPRVDYDMSEDIWYFSEGVSASDDKLYVTGRAGKVDSLGVVSLGKGVRVSWKLE